MNPPLLEAVLALHFDPVLLSQSALQYFLTSNQELFSKLETGSRDDFVLESLDHSTALKVATTHIELISTRGLSYPRLRPMWTKILATITDILGIIDLSSVALSYLNEIPLQELKSFRDHLNIGFEMPVSLNERLALFRSEFTFRSEPDEIRVWIQPEWDDRTDGYGVQLIFESKRPGPITATELPEVAQSLHRGIKEIFHQIVSPDYIRQLPQ